MGIYINPGKSAYEETVNSEIFVDKSDMIRFLNSMVKTNQKYISVSRPRRFGKSIAADMLCAYYSRGSDSRRLFETKKIALNAVTDHRSLPWDVYLEQFDVIRLTMTDFMEDIDDIEDMLSYLTQEVSTELMELYPDIRYGQKIKLRTVMNKVHASYGRQFVVIIDEWDAVFRARKNDKEGQTKYLNFLRDWLKDKTYIALAYMTGILPIKKYGEHSALNMFTEYSMTSPKKLAEYVGFTKEEVLEICREKDLNYEAMKEWYDGYRLACSPSKDLIQSDAAAFENNTFEIYCPLSVVNAAIFKRLENYWNKTETYEALAEYIRRDYDGLKDAVALLMDNGRLQIDISSYQNDMTTFNCKDDILSLLIHLGYLGYDDETGEVFIPNREILDEFRTSTKSSEWTSTFESFERSQKLLKATWEENEELVANLIESAHDQAENKTYNSEAALSYSIQLAYYAARKYYTGILEFDSGKGYADIVYLPAPKYVEKPVLLIELKYEKNIDSALEQIKKQNYPDRLRHYKGNILLVCINYDKKKSNTSPDFKQHTCRIYRA